MVDFLYHKFSKRISESQSVGPCDQYARQEKLSVASYNSKMLTFETTIYIGSRSTSPTSLSLLMSLDAIEGQDTGVRVSLRGGPQSRLQSSAVEKDGTSFQHTRRDGVVLRRVYQGSTNTDLFKDFIA